MVRKREERTVTRREAMYGGTGEATLQAVLTGPEEMNGKGRLFTHIALAPGHAIGHHVHEGESETFYVTRGTGQFDDNETTHTLTVGDVLHTPPGHGHAVRNTGAEPLEFVALILYN